MYRKLLVSLLILISSIDLSAQLYTKVHSYPGSFLTYRSGARGEADNFYVFGNDMMNSDGYLAKYTANGDTLWSRFYDNSSFSSSIHDVAALSNGMVYTANCSSNNLTVALINSNGIQQWQNTFNYSTFPFFAGVFTVATAASGTDLVAITGSYSSDSIVFTKINSAGAMVFSKTLNFTGLSNGGAEGFSPKKMITAANGDLIAVFDHYSDGGLNYQYCIMRITNTGNVVWVKSFSPVSGLSISIFNSIAEAANGDVLVSSKINLNGNEGSAYLRFSSTGNFIYGKQILDGAESSKIIELSTGELILFSSGSLLVSDINPKYAVLNLDASGNFNWGRNFGLTNAQDLFAAYEDASNRIVFAGLCNYYSSTGGVIIQNSTLQGEMSNCYDVITSVPMINWSPVISNHTGTSNNIASILSVETITSYAATQQVLQLPELVTSGTVIPPLCFGGLGGINTTVSNGTIPYSYNWSNGTGNQNLINAPAGNYSLRTSDSKGCIELDTFLLTQPSQLSATTSVTNVTCFGSQNGSIDLSPTGGTPGYTYQWATLATTEDITSLSGGFYQVIITDANNCTRTIGISVFEPQQLIAAINYSQNVSCYGYCDGELSGISSGGTLPHTFTWNDPSTTTGNSVTGLCPGNYLMTVTDDNGCISFSNGIITEPTILNVNTTSGGSECGQTNGMAVAAGSGGTTPYTYAWSQGTLNDTVSGLNPGVYTITLTDNNGCIITTATSIDVLTDVQDVCVVSVDSTNHNVVVWQKEATGNILGYKIYRDVVGAYSLIDFVPYDSLSEYTDMTFGVNPNITPYRYKVAVVDTCGNESNLSDYHQTIHLTSNVGVGGEVNLIWDNYQGFSYSYNRILRDSTGLGNWQVLDSVSNTSFTWTDLTPPTTARYLIEVVMPSTCTSTRAVNHNSTRSNRTQPISPLNAVGEFNLSSKVSVYPNPTNESATYLIDLPSDISGDLIITDARGRIIENRNVNFASGVNRIQLDFTDVQNGFYFISFVADNFKAVNKICVLK